MTKRLWPKPPKRYARGGGRSMPTAAEAALFGNHDDPERAVAWLERCRTHPGQDVAPIVKAIDALKEWEKHPRLKELVETARARRAKALDRFLDTRVDRALEAADLVLVGAPA